jgi:selenide,water dikinase
MRSPSADSVRHDLVLVGGGHAHIQVLRRWAMAPVSGCRLTLMVDRPVAVYSGMVPGFVAGQYARGDLEIDVRPLARRAGARVIVARVTGLDVPGRRVTLEGRPPIAYDTVSFDVGSTVAGLERPGVRAYAIATRPIGEFVRRVDGVVAAAEARAAFRVVVVGAGAGGVELAFALAARLGRDGGRRREVLLLEGGPTVLPGYAPGAARRVAAAATARGIAIRYGADVERVERDVVHLSGGERVPADAVVWVAGAAALPIFAGSGLETIDGFAAIGPTLQCVGRDEVFAVGDCAAWAAGPGLAKAGVYAVRQGPVLAHNLMARARGESLRAYRPQRDFLSLLNLGDGRAIGAKWGLAAEGRFLFSVKDWIDRRFVRRFQVLGPDDAVTADFARAPVPGEDMLCGGCAAKVGETPLARALERLGVTSDPAVVLGLAQPDDAAAVETERGEIVAATIDGFRAFADDPYLVGRVAAVNAVSDLWAKGVPPRFALAQVTVPDGQTAAAQEEMLYQVMAGARAGLDADGVTLVGGHTTTGPGLVVGFAVWGFAPSADSLLRIGGLAPGDQLILTKPLGTGVVLQADMRGLARGEWVEAVNASMLRSNAHAARAARAGRPSAVTDVTGFGLAGHLGEMVRASKAAAVLDLDAIPALPGAVSLLSRDIRSTAHPENAKARRAMRVEPEAAGRPALDLLFDPQTSGGLLLGVAAERRDTLLRALREAGDDATVIGHVTAPLPDGALIRVTAKA